MTGAHVAVPTLRLERLDSALPGDYVSALLVFPSGCSRPIRVGPEDFAALEEALNPVHGFDYSSVIDPSTGQPYPLWAGTEPIERPDPMCLCGEPWLERGCASHAAEVERLQKELGRLRPVVEAAKAFRHAAANPEHSQFWRLPWSEMADLCRAVDQMAAASEVTPAGAP